MEFMQTLIQRRSEYSLDPNIGISFQTIVDMVADVAVHIPSPYNIQGFILPVSWAFKDNYKDYKIQ